MLTQIAKAHGVTKIVKTTFRLWQIVFIGIIDIIGAIMNKHLSLTHSFFSRTFLLALVILCFTIPLIASESKALELPQDNPNAELLKERRLIDDLRDKLRKKEDEKSSLETRLGAADEQVEKLQKENDEISAQLKKATEKFDALIKAMDNDRASSNEKTSLSAYPITWGIIRFTSLIGSAALLIFIGMKLAPHQEVNVSPQIAQHLTQITQQLEEWRRLAGLLLNGPGLMQELQTARLCLNNR